MRPMGRRESGEEVGFEKNDMAGGQWGAETRGRAGRTTNKVTEGGRSPAAASANEKAGVMALHPIRGGSGCD